MAVSAKLYSKFILNALKSSVLDLNAAGSVIKVALFTSTYSPDQNADELYSALSNEVANGNGYTTGGATLATKAVTQSTTTIKFDADDVSWTSSTITARYAVIYDSTNSYLIGYVDFGADVSTTNGTFTITWHANGIFTITVS